MKKITDVVWELAEPVVQEHGCQLWDVEYVREAGQWYLRLFAPEQPDVNWDHPDIQAEFETTLRFWFDRGVDGFRIDVADKTPVFGNVCANVNYPSVRRQVIGFNDAGLAYSDTGWRVYGKLGTTFRFANTDELFGYDPLTYAPVFTGGNVRPQHGNNLEVGARYKVDGLMLQGAIYRLSLTDEIGYNPITYANENFDRTRREGLELNARWRALRNLELNAGLTTQNAKIGRAHV